MDNNFVISESERILKKKNAKQLALDLDNARKEYKESMTNIIGGSICAVLYGIIIAILGIASILLVPGIIKLLCLTGVTIIAARSVRATYREFGIPWKNIKRRKELKILIPELVTKLVKANHELRVLESKLIHTEVDDTCKQANYQPYSFTGTPRGEAVASSDANSLKLTINK